MTVLTMVTVLGGGQTDEPAMVTVLGAGQTDEAPTAGAETGELGTTAEVAGFALV